MVVQGQPGWRIHKIISKITRTKWTGGVTQVVQHLLCKPETLSLNPGSIKKKKKKKKLSSFCDSKYNPLMGFCLKQLDSRWIGALIPVYLHSSPKVLLLANIGFCLRTIALAGFSSPLSPQGLLLYVLVKYSVNVSLSTCSQRQRLYSHPGSLSPLYFFPYCLPQSDICYISHIFKVSDFSTRMWTEQFIYFAFVPSQYP
jgi:hypothetical protein